MANTGFKLFIAASSLLMALVASPALSQNAVSSNTAVNTIKPDNTRINFRDRNPDEATADEAGNKELDRNLMSGIRKAILADKSISTYGQNVKIIAENGKVVVKGPVRSQEESQIIEAKALAAAGAGNVTNEMSVAP
ncbi:MAG: BON domain-containing protein [Bdellovibrionales bacterium]